MTYTADAETFAATLAAMRAKRLPVAGLIRSWVGAVDGLVKWEESTA